MTHVHAPHVCAVLAMKRGRALEAIGILRFAILSDCDSWVTVYPEQTLQAVAARYSINYFWTTFLKRPFTGQHIDVREDSGNNRRIDSLNQPW